MVYGRDIFASSIAFRQGKNDIIVSIQTDNIISHKQRAQQNVCSKVNVFFYNITHNPSDTAMS